MKKKVLIVASSLHIGGIERSLSNLLCCIDYTKYDVDLFLYSNTGEYLKDIPRSVNLINTSWLLNCIGLTNKEALQTKNFFIIAVRVISALLCRYIGSERFFRFIFSFCPTLRDYDTAISYVHNVHPKTLYFGYNKFVLNNVEATNKIAFIHSDYVRAGFNYEANNDEYRQFDKIVNVSYAGKKIFDEILPDLVDKSFVVYNMYPINEIKDLSEKWGNPYEDINLVKFVSVGRLDINKSFDRVIEVAERLRNDGYNFRWYIVGEGDQETILKQKCLELNLQEYVIFVGSKKNPYPYIKYADIFVLTSKYEGMPMVVSEAQILDIPVVTTRYASAEEQVINNYTGLIVDNCKEGIYSALKQILDDEDYLKKTKNNLRNMIFSNLEAMRQFEKVVKLNNE